jgi:hypothetical protein
MPPDRHEPDESDSLKDFDFGVNDIGVFLMESITKGLYRDPRNALREYISNELDNIPRPSYVAVNVKGNQVDVIGDGPGMGYDEIRMAVRVGFSPKDPAKNIGFRGIGIYSGVSVCNRIRISTKKANTLKSYVISIDAAGLREDMGSHRKSSRTPLIESLRRNVKWSEFEAPQDQRSKHRTVVTLVDVLDTAASLLDEDGLRTYLENTVPIELDPKFPQRKHIEKFLLAHVKKDYRLTSMTLNGSQLCRLPDLPDLEDPETGVIRLDGKDVGCYWFCISQRSRKLPEATSRGFLLRKKGFSVGDRTTVQKLFPANTTLVNWVTGEIHITSPELLPNAERVELEQSDLRTKLDSWVGSTLGPKISQLAREKSAVGRATMRVNEATRLKTETIPTAWDELLEQMHRTHSLIQDLETDRHSRFLKGKAKTAVNNAFQQASAHYRKLNDRIVKIRAEELRKENEESKQRAETPPSERPAEGKFEAAGKDVAREAPTRETIGRRIKELCGRVGHSEWAVVLGDIVDLLFEENYLTDGFAADDFLDKLELKLAA